jgi:hydroxyethylthiazole kinase-like uncharacterized protein yjeF
MKTEYDLGIDALFGTGLTRGLPDDIGEKLRHFGLVPPVVSVDVPSGLCADSGKALGKSVLPSNLTVTFQFKKQGQFLDCGPELCGKLVSCDIGLARYDALKSLGVYLDPARETKFRRLDWTGVTRRLTQAFFEYDQKLGSSRLSKYPVNHKYAHGHALILSGPPGRTGAARLAARGALRIGAGLVTIGAAPEAIPEHAAHLNTIMLREAADGDGLCALLEDKRINALCLGPGLGLDDNAADLVAAALGWQLPGDLPLIDATDAQVDAWMEKHGRRPDCVLDADALTILARNPALFAALHGGCVLPPHAGEFARLFPDIAAKLAAPATKGPAYSKVDATREAAKRAGCTVLYKGPDTVIADPSGRCSINSAHYDRSAPWLATAGSGDVLAGFIAGLLARGFAPMQAAETAAWLHVECARKFGPGLIAEDLPEQLPAVFRDLGL